MIDRIKILFLCFGGVTTSDLYNAKQEVDGHFQQEAFYDPGCENGYRGPLNWNLLKTELRKCILEGQETISPEANQESIHMMTDINNQRCLIGGGALLLASKVLNGVSYENFQEDGKRVNLFTSNLPFTDIMGSGFLLITMYAEYHNFLLTNHTEDLKPDLVKQEKCDFMYGKYMALLWEYVTDFNYAKADSHKALGKSSFQMLSIINSDDCGMGFVSAELSIAISRLAGVRDLDIDVCSTAGRRISGEAFGMIEQAIEFLQHEMYGKRFDKNLFHLMTAGWPVWGLLSIIEVHYIDILFPNCFDTSS